MDTFQRWIDAMIEEGCKANKTPSTCISPDDEILGDLPVELQSLFLAIEPLNDRYHQLEKEHRAFHKKKKNHSCSDILAEIVLVESQLAALSHIFWTSLEIAFPGNQREHMIIRKGWKVIANKKAAFIDNDEDDASIDLYANVDLSTIN